MDKILTTQFKSIIDGIDLNQPAGSDARLDDDYDWIINEGEKLNSFHESQDIDFTKLHDLAYELLTKKTKDLKVFGWWLSAFLKINPKSNVLALTCVISKFLYKYGVDGYPKKDKAKLLCIEWIVELWEEVLNKDKSIQYSQIAVEQVDALSKKLNSHFLERSPSLYKIKLQIKNSTKTVERKINESTVKNIEQEEAYIAKPESSMAVQLINTSKEINSEKEEQKIIRNMQESTGLLMCYWSENSNLIMNILFLNRASSWAPIKKSPNHINHKTILKPVPVEKQRYYEEEINKNPSISLLIEMEKSLLKAPFWLTGHVFVIKLLQKLDKNTEVDLISRLLVSFLERLPELKNLMFDNGDQFIKDSDLDYIYKFCTIKKIETENNLKNNECNIKSMTANALKLYRSGKRIEAYSIFQDRIDKEKSKRFKLLCNIAIIELSLLVGRSDIAGYKFKEIDNEFTLFNRSEYEPQVELKLLKLKKQYNALTKSNLNIEEKNNLENAICNMQNKCM